jgi:hypothetical protein
MNDALRGFKKATDQLRIRFDAKQLVADDVRRLIGGIIGAAGGAGTVFIQG